LNNEISFSKGNIVETLNSFSVNKCQIVNEKKKDVRDDDLFHLEYNPKKLKILLWEPAEKPGTTIFVSSLVDGSDSLISILSKKYGQESYKIYINIDSRSAYPSYLFAYRKQDIERVIRSSFEDKWTFYQKGTPLSIEDTSVYDKKKIVDRLNKEVITSLLKKKGWNIEGDLFWTPISEVTTIHLKFRD